MNRFSYLCGVCGQWYADPSKDHLCPGKSNPSKSTGLDRDRHLRKAKQEMAIHDKWEYSVLMLRGVEALEQIGAALEIMNRTVWPYGSKKCCLCQGLGYLSPLITKSDLTETDVGEWHLDDTGKAADEDKGITKPRYDATFNEAMATLNRMEKRFKE